MKKKIIIIVSFVIILCAKMSVEANQTASDIFGYDVLSDGSSIRIWLKEDKVVGEVVIPEEIDGYKVKKISEYAFKGYEEITRIEIPESVTDIEFGAFEGCKKLSSIEIPTSVTNISDTAFMYCESVTSIKIPLGVTTIGYGTFYGCKSLTSIKIPTSITSIGSNAFAYCESLTKIEMHYSQGSRHVF